MKVLNPTSGFPAGDLTEGLGIPGNLALKASRIWLQDFHRTRANRDSSLGRAQTKPQRKGASLPLHQASEVSSSDPLGDWTKPPARAGSPVAARVGRGSPQGWRHWQQQSGKVPPGRNPLGGPINLTADSRAGSPQAKKLSGREHNLTQHQVIGLKLYWARPCPPEKDPVFPTTSLSHLN